MPMKSAEDLRVALEARMGEIAALLDDVAEALVHYPDEIEIVDDTAHADVVKAMGQVLIKASAWPTVQEIDRILSNWRALSTSDPGDKPRAA